jgi:hypothetical protein
MAVEMVLILGQHCRGVALVDDEDTVEEFSADAADERLGNRVRPWRSDRSFDHLDPRASQDRRVSVAGPGGEDEQLESQRV